MGVCMCFGIVLGVLLLLEEADRMGGGVRDAARRQPSCSLGRV